MILSDKDILKRLEVGDLSVRPLDDPDLQIQPASVDLRLGKEFLEFRYATISSINPRSDDDVFEFVDDIVVDENDTFVLHPGDFVLATTKEEVSIPRDLIGHVEGRSSLGRLAVVVHATAGLCDPGYEGQITLEMSNLGKVPVELNPGMRIAQLTFTELSSPSERPYGGERGSKYQGQEGPVPSKLGDDPDIT